MRSTQPLSLVLLFVLPLSARGAVLGNNGPSAAAATKPATGLVANPADWFQFRFEDVFGNTANNRSSKESADSAIAATTQQRPSGLPVWLASMAQAADDSVSGRATAATPTTATTAAAVALRSPVCSCRTSRRSEACQNATTLLCRLAPGALCEGLTNALPDAAVLPYLNVLCGGPAAANNATGEMDILPPVTGSSSSGNSSSPSSSSGPSSSGNATAGGSSSNNGAPTGVLSTNTRSGSNNSTSAAFGPQPAPTTPGPTNPAPAPPLPPCVCAYLGLASPQCRQAADATCATSGSSAAATTNTPTTASYGAVGAAGIGTTASATPYRSGSSSPPPAAAAAAAVPVSAAAGPAAPFNGLCDASLHSSSSQSASASSLPGATLSGIYGQLRTACFPGAISAPSFCSCLLDPLSSNCALSTSSLCASGDPLCRLTLAAWEGQASAIAILKVYFSSACGGGGGGYTQAGGAAAPGGAVDGGAAGVGIGGAGSGVIVRLELPGVSRSSLLPQQYSALSQALAGAANVSAPDVRIFSVIELPPALARTSAAPATNTTAEPQGAAGAAAAAAAANDSAAGFKPLPSAAASAAAYSIGPTSSGGSSNLPQPVPAAPTGATSAATGNRRRRRLLQVPATPTPTPAKLTGAEPSVLVTAYIAAPLPLATEALLQSILADLEWLLRLQQSMGLPYLPYAVATETITGDEFLQGSGAPAAPAAPTPAVAAPGVAQPAPAPATAPKPPATADVGGGETVTPLPVGPGPGWAQPPESTAATAPGGPGASEAGAEEHQSQPVGAPRAEGSQAWPIAVGVVVAACAVGALASVLVYVRLRRRRAAAFRAAQHGHNAEQQQGAVEEGGGTSGGHEGRKTTSPPKAPAADGIKGAAGNGGTTPRSLPTHLHVRCGAAGAAAAPAAAAGAAAGFSFPPLGPAPASSETTEAAAAAAASAGTPPAHASDMERNVRSAQARARFWAQYQRSGGGGGRSGRRTPRAQGGGAVAESGAAGSAAAAVAAQQPAVPDSPVLGLGPAPPPAVRPLLPLALPRWDSSVTNASHMAQMSPSTPGSGVAAFGAAPTMGVGAAKE